MSTGVLINPAPNLMIDNICGRIIIRVSGLLSGKQTLLNMV